MYKTLNCVFFFVLALPVAAHRPYYSDAMPLELPGQANMTLVLWNGDGIFGPDPSRAIVLDEARRLRAVSPMATGLMLSCRGTGADQTCLAFDPQSWIVFLPELTETVPIDWPETDGWPTTYPELWAHRGGPEFGFRTRPASAMEIARFSGASLIRYPIASLALTVWWAVIWTSLAPLFWRLLRVGRPLAASWAGAILRSLLQLLLALLLMFLLEVYVFFMGPLGQPMVIAAIIGLLLALWLTWPPEKWRA